MNHISVLHNIQSVGQTSFGLGQVAVNLVKELNLQKCNAKIWCLDGPDDVHYATESSGLPESDIVGFKITGPRMLWFTPQMESAASGPDGRIFQIVHQHGIWTGVSRVTNIMREKFCIPTVVAPHGSLNPWALNRSRWKKKIALAIYENNNLHSASCLHAIAETEVNYFRDFGLLNPIAVIRNGYSDKMYIAHGDPERFRNQYGIQKERRILLFLSRITPIKGLPMLIEAIKAIQSEFAEWLLVIAGIDEFGHQAEVEKLIRDMNLNENITIIGPLFDQAKIDAFSAAEIFILPSFSEGCPVSILDSLAAGVPVITTKASAWEQLNTHDCGWCVDINSNAISNALRDATAKTKEQLEEKGQRGRTLVASKYTWAELAGKTIELYLWLLNCGDKPDFVILD